MPKYEKFIGGVGIGLKVMWDEVPPEAGAFDPENRIVFAPGPLVGIRCEWQGLTAHRFRHLGLGYTLLLQVYPMAFRSNSLTSIYFARRITLFSRDQALFCIPTRADL